MFTGIIESIGSVRAMTPKGGDLRVYIATGKLDLGDVKLGDSIAVNGVCLTAVELPGDGFWADVSRESLARTAFQHLKVGSRVNLEKALTPTTRLGGHLVSGHVDGVGEVLKREENARAIQFTVRAPRELARYIAHKGSITVDGTSLTVNAVNGAEFELTIVPHTLSETIMAEYQPDAGSTSRSTCWPVTWSACCLATRPPSPAPPASAKRFSPRTVSQVTHELHKGVPMALNTIDELIEDIRQGKMVILMDDEDRENEGDLIMAAECVRTEDINFMVKHARGLVCMPMTRERCERLGLPLMVQRNGSGFGTKFTVSIEAAEGVTTGISAADRARTVQAAAAKNAVAADIVSPGHIFPLMAQPGGTLARAGHTEAACDLARMAGFEPSGVICEVMNDDGSMARRPELEAFAAEHGIKIGTIADLIHYRLIHERTVERIAEQPLDSELGHFNLITYRDSVEGDVHLALTLGKVCAEEPTLVRVHNMDPLRDLLQVSQPGRWSLRAAMTKVAEAGSGVVLLLGHQIGGDDLLAHVREIASAPAPAPKATTTYSTVGAGSQILRDLGVRKMRLLSAPMRFNAISGFDLEVVEYLPAE